MTASAPIARLLTPLALALLAGPAAAGEAPGFATLARIGEHPTLGFATAVSDSAPSSGAAVAWRFDLYGWTPVAAGFGLHAQATLGTAQLTRFAPADADSPEGGPPIGSDSVTALWGAVIGGHWLARFKRGGIPIAAGVVLPTASSGADARRVLEDGLFGRVTDSVATFAPATWIRLSTSPWLEQGRVRMQVDLGADVPVTGDDDPVLRLGLGLSARLGPVAPTAELAALSSGDVRDMALTTAVGLRFVATPVRPGLHVVLPIGSLADDETAWWTLSLEWVPGAAAR